MFFFASPLTIFGQDAGLLILRTSLQYQIHLFLFVLSSCLYSSAIIFFITFPFFLVGWHKTSFYLLVLLTYALLFIASFHKTPTLYIEFFKNGKISIFFAEALKFGYSAGLFVVACLLVLLFFKILKSKKYNRFGVLYLAMLVYLFFGSSQAPYTLPAKSVVLYFADSLRADSFAKHAQHLQAQLSDQPSYFTPDILPTSARTAASLTSFFTGLMPSQHGVLNMFTSSQHAIPESTLISDFKEKGYCTIAITEYPGDFLKRWNYGFDHVEAPITDWQNQLNQIVLSRSLATLSLMNLIPFSSLKPSGISNAFNGLIQYSEPTNIHRRFFKNASTLCKNKPVLAFLFLGTTHLPYSQKNTLTCRDSQSVYLGSTPWSEQTDSLHVKCLYENAVQIFSENVEGLLTDLLAQNSDFTFIITSDHAEYIKDKTQYNGHGDHLLHPEGLMVPLLVFSPQVQHYQNLPHPASHTLMRELIVHNTIPKTQPPPIIESEVWFDKKNSPSLRIDYPEGRHLFAVDKSSGFLILKPEWEKVVESGKLKLAFFNGDTYKKIPLKSKILYFKNDIPLDANQLPQELQTQNFL